MRRVIDAVDRVPRRYSEASEAAILSAAATHGIVWLQTAPAHSVLLPRGRSSMDRATVAFCTYVVAPCLASGVKDSQAETGGDD